MAKNVRTKPKRRQASRNKRMIFVGVLAILCMAALLANIGYITLTYGADFERRAVRQLIIRQSDVEQIIHPVRGGILDRNRQPLVDNEIVYNVALDVNVILSLPDNRRNQELKNHIIQTLHENLNIPINTLEGYLNPYSEDFWATYWRVIARHVSAYIALPLAEELPHVHLEPVALQRFPDPYLAPQVLGFVRGDASWGLELQYRNEIAGSPGRIFRAFQSDAAPIEDIPARDGYSLVTTLDAGIQRIAQRVVEEAAFRYQAQFTAIAVMQPHTGEILAMAQWPSFPLDAPDDGTRFTDPAVSNFWHDMDDNEQLNHMFRTWPNFSLSRTFEPGSTFKPFVIAAALEEGIISPEISRFYCAGVRTVADWDIGCMSIHGSLTLEEALIVSCNIAMMEIAQAMGRGVFYRYRNDFGFGEQTGIDLPGEEAVSGPGVMYTLAQLNPVELATSSFGQGFNTTAIQALNAFAALINGGYVMRPHVVSQLVDANGNVVRETTPTVVRNILSHQTSDFMRTAMQSVVSSPHGTGRRAVIEGHTLGGKTGTGEQGVPRGSWVVTSFIGYMPVENPQFVAIAVVYNPYNTELTAGASAAPMIREVFEDIINYRQLPPAGAEQHTGVLVNAGGEIMQDFSGMELRVVTQILNSMGIDYIISGRGAILSHHIPAAGQQMPRGAPVLLYLDGDISDLYELTFVPSVEGLPKERAIEQIIAMGLVPEFTSAEPTGRGLLDESDEEQEAEENLIVYRQSPRPGLHIQRGTQVRLRTKAH